MELKISLLLLHILIIGVIYSLCWLCYRYILHADYRWNQKGNVCYEHARNFSTLFTVIIIVILVIIHHSNIIFTW